MRRRAAVILVLAAMACLSSLFALSAGILGKGFKAGMVLTTVTGRDVQDQKIRPGVGAGVEVPALSGQLSLEGHYTSGTGTLSGASGNDIRNGAAYFLLGWAF